MSKIKNNLDLCGKVYVCSDPHFGHKSILRFERTEFETYEEHDKFIIDRINKKVKPNDWLIILGDLGTNWYNQIDAITTKNKILILGNHDKEATYKYEKYFKKIIKGPYYYTNKIVLSHEPAPINTAYAINVHGHLHGSCLDLPGYFNVSMTSIDYTPVEMSEIVKKTHELKRYKESFMQEWYAPFYKFDRERTHDKAVLQSGKIHEDWQEINAFLRSVDVEVEYKKYNWDNFIEAFGNEFHDKEEVSAAGARRILELIMLEEEDDRDL